MNDFAITGSPSADEEDVDTTVEDVAETATEATEEVEAATEEAATETEAAADDGKPKPEPWFQKRISEVTAKRHEAETRAEKAERERDALKELLASGRTEDEGGRTYTEAELKAEAARIAEEKVSQDRQLAAQQQFNARCNTVVEDGQKAFGAAFDTAIGNLNMAGVINDRDTSFIEAALETESPALVLKHLGDDPDEAVRIASLSPVQRGIQLERLASKLTAAAPKPQPAPLSKAPPPIAPVAGDRARGDVDLSDPDVDDATWFAEMQKRDRAKG